ncbi:DUF1472 domain-containing protein (plasmid) [Deinococcus wulumuqiensis]|uniref:DUF1472 domain-containing protein n=1 Tax=Deinococcus wulumuqiensis TaxID=980427 RepID=A0A345IMK5_9DEIO|nr:DUF1472 domain-containing protein [Deinococcus wulumuqiensis]
MLECRCLAKYYATRDAIPRLDGMVKRFCKTICRNTRIVVHINVRGLTRGKPCALPIRLGTQCFARLIDG